LQTAEVAAMVTTVPKFAFSEQKLKILPPTGVYAMFSSDSHPARNAEICLKSGIFTVIRAP
jgi:hypothetical protein